MALMGLPQMADQQVPGIRFKDCNNLFVTCLQSMLLGVIFQDNLVFHEKSVPINDRLPVQIFVKAYRFYGYLLNMSGPDIETVEVFKTDGLSNINRNYQSDGIVSIITKKVENQK
jgi:hypothetical protein